MPATLQVFAYTLQEPDAAERIRQQAKAIFCFLPGYVCWRTLRPLGETVPRSGELFVDVMEWESPEAAEKANELFRHDDRLSSFRKIVADLVVGGEFAEAGSFRELHCP